MKKQCFFLILLNSIIAFQAFSQENNPVIVFADALALQGNFSQAVKEYQRAVFFAANKNDALLYMKLADCYAALGDNQNAAKYYDLVYFNAISDSIKYSGLLKKSHALLLQRQYNLALVELFSLPDSLPPFFQYQRNLFTGIALFATEQYHEAENYFILCIQKDDTLKIKKIKQLFARNKEIDKIKPQRASILSLFIPGLGQIYSGDYRNGINSMLLVGGLWVLYSYISYRYGFIDAFLSVFPWMQRYYTGGYEDAYDAAVRKKAIKREHIYKQLLLTVSD